MNDNDVLLSAYADGELDEAITWEVEAYLGANPVARRTVEMHHETVSWLRAALAEGQFARETARETDRMPAVRRPRASVPRHFWAMAASILFAVAGFGAGTTWPALLTSGRESMLTEIAEYHSVYSRETAHLVKVPAGRPTN